MKRIAVRFVAGLLTFATGVIAVLLWLHSSPQPSRAEPAYEEVATYIANQVLALEGKVAGFESISHAGNVYIKEYPFKPIVDYRHGVLRYKPVPDSEPPMEEAVFAKDGFMLAVWMVKGELTWKPERPPIEIGPYNIDAQVSGPQREKIQPIIDRIVAEAAEHFNQTAQSNNGMHPTAHPAALICGNRLGAAGDAGS